MGGGVYRSLRWVLWLKSPAVRFDLRHTSFQLRPRQTTTTVLPHPRARQSDNRAALYARAYMQIVFVFDGYCAVLIRNHIMDEVSGVEWLLHLRRPAPLEATLYTGELCLS